ncbi:hypothetical protein [Flavonifractor sp. HCP28S3_F3]|uniref:hypothetical protein n=1 Tax=Flavonifractor sp. HCP28S3_F3 TaxID=3438939 RepID=UPI003F89A2D6
MTIRCPHCGSPVMVRGNRWECGWCGDFGGVSSLHPTEQAKLMQVAAPSISFTITVTDTSDDEEETPSSFSRSELEDMVRRWDFSENEWACRDLLIAAFPETVSRWSAEELSEMDAMNLMVETGERDPETAIQMMKLLLDTAEMHLQNPEAAYFLLGNELYDLCLSGYIRPRLLEHLKADDRLARQLFQSAYVGSPQEDILLSCSQLEEKELRQKLLDFLACNPFPHDKIELEPDEA